jgi:RNA 2',3'-cyclic 3'-phosphodiesterase
MRLFVSVEIPTSLKEKIVSIQNKLSQLESFKGTLVRPENLHITLAFIGSKMESEIDAIAEKLATVIFPSFKIVATSIEKRAHVIWISVESEKLEILALKIGELFPTSENRPYNGHITIARIKEIYDVDALKKATSECIITPTEWVVSTFELQRSITYQEGPMYEPLESFRLSEEI